MTCLVIYVDFGHFLLFLVLRRGAGELRVALGILGKKFNVGKLGFLELFGHFGRTWGILDCFWPLKAVWGHFKPF